MMKLTEYFEKYGELSINDKTRGIKFYSNGTNFIGGKTSVADFRKNNKSWY